VTSATAVAIDPAADPWAMLRQEGGLAAGATCPAWTATATTADCGGWTLTVHRGVSPATLAAALAGGTTAAGEMVLVHLARTTPPADPDDDDDASTDDRRLAAVGVARNEPRS